MKQKRTPIEVEGDKSVGRRRPHRVKDSPLVQTSPVEDPHLRQTVLWIQRSLQRQKQLIDSAMDGIQHLKIIVNEIRHQLDEIREEVDPDDGSSRNKSSRQQL